MEELKSRLSKLKEENSMLEVRIAEKGKEKEQIAIQKNF